jgi:hypothetical protein
MTEVYVWDILMCDKIYFNEVYPLDDGHVWPKHEEVFSNK